LKTEKKEEQKGEKEKEKIGNWWLAKKYRKTHVIHTP